MELPVLRNLHPVFERTYLTKPVRQFEIPFPPLCFKGFFRFAATSQTIDSCGDERKTRKSPHIGTGLTMGSAKRLIRFEEPVTE